MVVRLRLGCRSMLATLGSVKLAILVGIGCLAYESRLADADQLGGVEQGLGLSAEVQQTSGDFVQLPSIVGEPNEGDLLPDLPEDPVEEPHSTAAPATAASELAPGEKEPRVGSADADGKPTATRERIQELIQGVPTASGLDDVTKAELLKRYQAALQWLQTADEANQKTAQYENEMGQVHERIERARTELAATTADVLPPVVSTQSLAELEGLLAQTQSQLDDAKSVLSHREDELKRRGERKGELAKLTEETKGRVEEAEKSLTAPATSGEASETTTARRLEMEARRAALVAQQTLYQTEAKRLDTLADLFPLQRDLALRDVSLREKQVVQLQQLVAQVRKQESERQAVEARRQAELADPALAEWAQTNTQLAEKRQDIANRITLVSQEASENEKLLTSLNSSFQRARDKVARAGHSTTVGLMLRKQREELPSVRRCLQRLAFVEREMPVANLDRLEMEDERAALSDLEAVAQQVTRRLHDQPDAMYGEHLQQTVRELLDTKRTLLDKLINELDTYLAELSELEVSNRRLIAQTAEFREFTDEHVLWIRSAEPFHHRLLPSIADGVLALLRPTEWARLIKKSGVDTLRQPLMAAIVFAVFVLLTAFHAQMRRRIRDLCGARLNSVGWRFSPSIRALLWTAVATATWPLLVWYTGWRMTTALETSDLGLAIGPSLKYAAMLSWLSDFLRSLCRRQGVAEIFFSWSPASLALARRSLWWLTWLGLPLASLVRICQVYENGTWGDSLGRTAFVLVMLLLAGFAHAILRRSQNIFREALAKDPQGWLNQMRAIAHTAGIVLPLALAGLALVGYYYSALQLAVRLQATLGLALFVLLVHAVTSRWFLVTRRRLALQQFRDRQQTNDSGDNATNNNPSGLIISDAPNWSEVHERLRLLLRQAVSVGMLAGVWFIWSDVLPALRILDRVELWVQTIEVTETIEDGSGQLVRKTYPRDVPTTMRHGLIAVICLMGTFLLGRNLPALLEITVLNQLPLDRGGRHAICVLLYYSVALTGVIVACHTLHINWSSIQWLAAGITVGLGFGLQEIFANFVSGIILLFERPIRVGDIITLDDVSGTVTSIRMRATTVTDHDRKELIVPNKALITGRLLNWTLSDTMNRIVIQVGLAYTTDPLCARQILLDTVQSHRNILADPEPSVTFESFGDSSLVLRCG
jgi:potassium-dependent mechanosensitive channel